VPKITKMDAFFLFQSETSIFHDEEPSFTPSPGAKKARTVLQLSPKFSTMVKNKKDDRQTNKKTNSQVCKNLKIQKFNFNTRARIIN
jgi:hypothetical protein